MNKTQKNYLKAKALKDAAWNAFAEDDADEIIDTYSLAQRNCEIAEKALIEWALEVVSIHPLYKAHEVDIRHLAETKIPSYRRRLIDLCMSLDPNA